MVEQPHPPLLDALDDELDDVDEEAAPHPDLEHFDVHAWFQASDFEVREPELLGVPFN